MKRILITRPRKQADSFAKKLRAAGFEPIYFPVIEIQPMRDNPGLDQALENISRYHWIIFTSVNGVEAVCDRCGSIKALKTESFPHLAAIGPKTAEALQEYGLSADFVPEEYVAEAILPGLGELSDKWVLLPRAEIARQVLPEAIAMRGGIAHEIAVYKTLPAALEAEGLQALKQGVDVVTLTSPSAVQNFVAIVRASGLDPLHLPGAPRFACIGPITRAAAQEEGLPELAAAQEYTTQGLVELIRGLAGME
jgi:uroporphyrinogen III methyltransferase/synthase